MAEYKFIVYWCSEGLEAIVPVDMDGGYAMDVARIFSDQEPTYVKELQQTIFYMKMRAQANSHCYYECYVLTTNDIDEDTLRGCFEDSPQMIVNLIREKGVHLFGTPRGRETPVIT